MKTDSPLYVGIDLGTTNSAVALFDGSEVEVVRNGLGSSLTPSVVRIDARGRVTVGARARAQFEHDPANVRGEFKRLMGSANELEFPAAKTTRRPQDLSAAVLASLRQDVADLSGVLPERAVISVPALFELHQTAATAEAARLAGFDSIELIQEPVASAIAAGWKREDSSGPWLVYDLGGGTLDVSLLETRDGLLRTIGHDGDNFLGGRDFDSAVLDLLLRKLSASGVQINPADPANQTTLRRLRVAAEEAKIELTRGQEALINLCGLTVHGSSVDVESSITREEFDEVAAPLIERTVAVTARLLSRHGIPNDALQRFVLVGGPTVMPLLRQRIVDHFGAAIAPSIDPMTLVAQGAALFAGTVGLCGRPAKAAVAAEGPTGPRVWLQFPAVTPDLTPFLVGKVLERSVPITAVEIEREDGTWKGEPAALGSDGSFATMVELSPRQNCRFNLWGLLSDHERVALTPGKFSITHGITLGEPPLARSVGVALADNSVRVFFERGLPLPSRRAFMFTTAVSVPAGMEGFALQVPIVQGEFRSANFCRLVGSLEIPASRLGSNLLLGSEIEVTMELDKGGNLLAEARILATNQVFDQVALLLTQAVSLDGLEEAVASLQKRLDELSRQAFKSASAADVGAISEWLGQLTDIRRNAEAFRGGDLDAGEQARRAMADLDSAIAEMDSAKAWPALLARAESMFLDSLGTVGRYGTPAERQAFEWAYGACKSAIAARQAEQAERQLGVMSQIESAAYFRQPGAWEGLFEAELGRLAESRDLKTATELADQGRAAKRDNRQSELERVVRQLWKLRVVTDTEEIVGHGSGLLAP